MSTERQTKQQPGTQHVKANFRYLAKNPKVLWGLVRDAVSAWSEDYAPSMGAALSYYTVFSIAPLLLIVISIAGLVFGREAASGQIFETLGGLVGDEGAKAIQGMVNSASDTGKSTFGAIIGVVTLLLGATTVFGELQTDLDRIWKAPAAEKKEGLWNMLRTRVLSFGLILAIGFLLLVSLVVSAGLAALGNLWGDLAGGMEALLHVVNFIVSFAVITALFAVMYRFLPRVKVAWPDVWIGAAFTSLLFTIGKFLIGLYIGKSSVASGFGAAGSLVVVLLWVYYSAQIFLFGAEFTAIYAHRYGSRVGEEFDAASRDERRLPTKSSAASLPARDASPRTKPGLVTNVTTAALNKNPKVELGLGLALGVIATGLAWWQGRLRR